MLLDVIRPGSQCLLPLGIVTSGVHVFAPAGLLLPWQLRCAGGGRKGAPLPCSLGLGVRREGVIHVACALFVGVEF